MHPNDGIGSAGCRARRSCDMGLMEDGVAICSGIGEPRAGVHEGARAGVSARPKELDIHFRQNNQLDALSGISTRSHL
jgi:hypothetical protein